LYYFYIISTNDSTNDKLVPMTISFFSRVSAGYFIIWLILIFTLKFAIHTQYSLVTGFSYLLSSRLRNSLIKTSSSGPCGNFGAIWDTDRSWVDPWRRLGLRYTEVSSMHDHFFEKVGLRYRLLFRKVGLGTGFVFEVVP
jgi:hypothetical protein